MGTDVAVNPCLHVSVAPSYSLSLTFCPQSRAEGPLQTSLQPHFRNDSGRKRSGEKSGGRQGETE